jgi:3-carboxy-cis,cis-muconate cycloisomerase
MPQKSNPVRSELLVAAARHNATLVSGMHHALVQEHERGTHGWQVEWLTLGQMVDCTGGALANALALVRDLVVRSDRMARNVGATHGVMLAEAASLLLSRHREREEAERVVKEAAVRAKESGTHLFEILEEMVSPPIDWSTVREEANYLGATQSFLDRVLERADGVRRA